MSNVYTITSPRNDRVFIHVMQGHFISSNNHINYHIGTSDVKHNHRISVDTAMLLSEYYTSNDIHIDTVLCLYETQALGAYLAHELARPSMLSPNPDSDIFVVGSEYDTSGNLIFRDNLKRMIRGKNVLVLISCITSGRTVERAMESVQYYGGNVVGVSAVFSAIDNVAGVHVNTIFDINDVPGYAAFPAHNCPYCQNGTPVDAISNGYGYSKM